MRFWRLRGAAGLGMQNRQQLIVRIMATTCRVRVGSGEGESVVIPANQAGKVQMYIRSTGHRFENAQEVRDFLNGVCALATVPNQGRLRDRNQANV